MDGLDASFYGTAPIISTALLNEDDPVVLRQYITGMQDTQRDAFLFGDNLIAQFFITQSELSDQQRERD